VPLLDEERAALEAFRAGHPVPARSDAVRQVASTGDDGERSTDEGVWTTFLLRTVLEAVRRVRAAAPSLLRFKGDGSPVTELERGIELEFRAALEAFDPGAAFVGEESGGQLDETGWTLSIDPIDGSWAFLSHTETFSVVMNLFREGQPFMGVVASPVIGEIGHAAAGGRTRLIRLDLVGEGDQGFALPVDDRDPDKILVNLHPSGTGSRLMSAFYRAWELGEVRMVRAPGGSPSWAMLEAARGHFTYVNEWARSAADPWDLAAGVLLVNGAGGVVVDIDGQPIDPVGHIGPFVAGVSEDQCSRVLSIIRDAVAV
jgi:fructose-1,6-bisphosphatase/inositol monophosphatase family enzyme